MNCGSTKSSGKDTNGGTLESATTCTTLFITGNLEQTRKNRNPQQTLHQKK
jgi:hypothetical protein